MFEMWEQLLDQFNMFFECHVTSYFVQPTLRILGRQLVYGKALGWAQDEMLTKSGPAFWECPSPKGFTYCKAQGKIYHEPNLHRS